MPIIKPKWIARALATGRAPGSPKQTAQVRVLGGSPKESSQPQNIFVRVASWIWISRPMTGSYRLYSYDTSRARMGHPGGVGRSRSLASKAWAASSKPFSLKARARELKAHGKPRPPGPGRAASSAAEAAWDRDRGDARQGHGDGEVVVQVHGDGSPVLEPSSKATVGLVGVTMKSTCVKTVAEVLDDLCPHPLGTTVEGVVVAGRQSIGAEHDAPLDLWAEAS